MCLYSPRVSCVDINIPAVSALFAFQNLATTSSMSPGFLMNFPALTAFGGDAKVQVDPMPHNVSSTPDPAGVLRRPVKGRSSGVLCYMPVRRDLPRVKLLLLKKPLIQLPKSILVAIPFQQDFSLGKSQPPVLCMFLRDLHGRWIHLDRKAVLWNYKDTLAPEFSSRHILHSRRL